MQVQVVDYRAADAAEKFTRSLHETGFGVLTNHPIRQALVEKIYADWLAFFNSDAKDGFAFSKETQDGYFSTAISETAKGSQQKDIKEYFHVYPWGRIPEQLKADRRALRLRHADHQHRRHAAGSLGGLLPVDAASRRQPDRRRREEEPRVAAAVPASARQRGAERPLHGGQLPQRAAARTGRQDLMRLDGCGRFTPACPPRSS
ncbi:MAG: 2-oxoglutarate and iron-dependent oxygenase domain-containing protein [Burkholderiales bacterium]|nr:2-oxoglutarate and iron-dependent oxygenase domain-containing protein [Burkholderiales bacterium]